MHVERESMIQNASLDLSREEYIDALITAASALGFEGREASKLSLLKQALELQTSTAVLRLAFKSAIKLNRYRDSLDLLNRITPLLGETEKDEKWLADARRSFNSLAIDYMELSWHLKVRRNPKYQPITGCICYVLHNSLPYSSGGYATRAHGLAQGLNKEGYEVIAMTRPGFPADTISIEPDAIAGEEIIDGVRYIRTITPARDTHRGMRYIMESADALTEKFTSLRPALIIAASNHLTSLPAQIAARRLGIPFIYEVRGFWEVTRWSREPEFVHTKAYADLAGLEALSAKHADHVFTLTGAMADELVRRGVPSDLISLLPNSCDPTRFTPRGRDEVLASKLGIPPDTPVIGYIGSFVQYEGLDDLAEACSILANRGIDFRLMLIGNENVSGNDKGPITTAIEQFAAQGGLAEKLIMPGRIPHEEVEAHYSLIDIAPFPRKPQPVTEMVSPMKPLEAYAMEKAVISSSVQALAEMVEHEGTGLIFKKGCVNSLADCLERLIHDAELRTMFGKAGRAWVENERTWQQTALRAKAKISELV